jgi:hypothetical protein
MTWRALSARPYEKERDKRLKMEARADEARRKEAEARGRVEEIKLRREAWPASYCSARHPTHYEASFIWSFGIL